MMGDYAITYSGAIRERINGCRPDSATYSPAMRVRQNLQLLMDRGGYNPYSLAAAVPGVTQPTIHRILSGESEDPKTKTLQPLADFFGVTVAALRSSDLSDAATPPAGGFPQPITGTKVPVVNFATLTGVSVGQDFDPAKMAVEWTLCHVKHGSLTFAFRMPDNSMACATEDSIPAGHMVWVDPGQRDVEHDTTVLARLESGQHLVAQYMEQAGRRWLHLLNSPAYPPVPPGTSFEVVGRVIFSGRER